MRTALGVLPLLATVLWPLAGMADDGGTPLSPVPTTEECVALGATMKPLPFGPGERLVFDVDALGAKAGSMITHVLPRRPDGRLPIEVDIASNSFFSKIRDVKGTGRSLVDPRTLRPSRYLEESVENQVRRVAEVAFNATTRTAKLISTTDGRTVKADLQWGNDITDVAGAVFLLRSMPLEAGRRMCFDVYAIRRIWRVWGEVQPREHVSSPLGEFEAFHLKGEAARLDRPNYRREVHVWFSDDARRLPLAAVGVIDLGAVRATLVEYQRPGESAKAENKANMTW